MIWHKMVLVKSHTLTEITPSYSYTLRLPILNLMCMYFMKLKCCWS